jgi:hypothetical protein
MAHTVRVNPVIPAVYDLLWAVVPLAVTAFAAVALITLVLDVRALAALGIRSTTYTLGWIAVIVLIPVVGPILWFALRRASAPA